MKHPGYQLTQFYKHYNDFVKEHYGNLKLSMPVERVLGEKQYIDWGDDQPKLMTNSETGEISKVHIFTTTLGFSSLIYAEIFPGEELQSFITGVIHALQFYAAVPKYLVPDNPKTAVMSHTKNGLVPNTVFSDLEDFYGTVVLPPRCITDKTRIPVEHRHYKESNAHGRVYSRRWASVFGEATSTILIDRMLHSVKHKKQAYNGCSGIFHVQRSTKTYRK